MSAISEAVAHEMRLRFPGEPVRVYHNDKPGQVMELLCHVGNQGFSDLISLRADWNIGTYIAKAERAIKRQRAEQDALPSLPASVAEEILKKAEAGYCQYTAGGKHEFLKDIIAICHRHGIHGLLPATSVRTK